MRTSSYRIIILPHLRKVMIKCHLLYGPYSNILNCLPNIFYDLRKTEAAQGALNLIGLFLKLLLIKKSILSFMCEYDNDFCRIPANCHVECPIF